MLDSLRERARSLPSWKELRGRSRPVRNVNEQHAQSLSTLERVAMVVTDRVGTMGFFLIILGWTVIWLGWNVLAPRNLRFDPYPAFVLWLFISNLVQIHLMPLIMVGQNLQGRHSEFRAQSDYEVNLKAETEVEAILTHLEHQNEIMLEILQRIEKL
ncbi:MAG TPA: DUF1003 domain-containing protein, partial [Chloroflexota bacterium]|nr:DUF1003 domain-containing protein [Chloroflexota bacterium]